MTTGRRGRFGIGFAACAIVLAAGLAATSWAQPQTHVGLPGKTTEGRFEGTWIYRSRDFQAAIWLRDRPDGPPEVRFHYVSNAAPEEFATDWTGHATYYIAGQPATFAIDLTEGNADEARGTWNWSVQFAKAGREEKGRFSMYRAADGRQLVLKFDEYTRTLVRGDDARRYDFDSHAMTFFKASRRLVLWEELPF